MAGGHSHRGTLKKAKKPFKSKHATKGQLKDAYKGKVEKTKTGSQKSNKAHSKLARRNIAKQSRDQKILETKFARRVFEGSLAAEKIVTVIALTPDLAPHKIAAQLVNSAKANPEDPDVAFEYPSVNDVKVGRYKSNLKVIIPDQNNLLAVMDAAKCADFVVFGISATEEVDSSYGEQILRALTAQGIASVIGVLPNVASAYPKRNLQMDIRQSLFSFFTHFFPSEEKLYALEVEAEASNCIRTICQKFPKSITWRDSRGYMVADSVKWSTEDPNNGQLVIEGTVRGIGFNANKLVHIPGHGDFQIEKMEKITRMTRMGDMDLEDNIYIPNENQESLDELNPEDIDFEDEEGSWEDEIEDGYSGIRMDGQLYFNKSEPKPTKQIKAPKGTSEYQARWFVNDEMLSEDDEDEDSIFEDNEMVEENIDEVSENNNNASEYAPTEAGDEMFLDLSPEEEERQLNEYRAQEKEDLDFPDELELDPSMSAKNVLSSHRGVKSLFNCDWDFDEHDPQAPSVWKRLLRIGNYKATRNRVNKEGIKQAQVVISNKVRIFLKAPSYILESANAQVQPFIIYELLDHEHQLAVVNFSFNTWEDYEKPVVSNESIIVQYGPRRQIIKPTFNQATNSPNNVHKFERFAHQGVTTIATTIAPVTFNSSPAIFFKPTQNGGIEFVGLGTFLNCDHTRIIAERTVLTGDPFKFHKNVVTVRYMFFSPEDINWFKAVPLFTKSGRTGFIKESLGTHGYFKATFDGKLSAQDCVAMALYKRVWPEVSTPWLG
ncbi:uncharacterized protein KQ657_004569 [Scheffersomyces spartinae]|uniref:Bms1-type G domain-containing protein n=1 Tax=Scheffersomyces spartinae TaxID=45513 RepID=A0A9P8AJR1_9ASCO|nr:uncharacterized protein KQ657_004569 [Scheffersomyces spartinae]KAG7194357.1 hypothetical protein KQ657_004569 [Scheffersomyces spartinae]